MILRIIISEKIVTRAGAFTLTFNANFNAFILRIVPQRIMVAR